MACFGRILKAFAGLLGDERGVTSAEYAILAVGVVIFTHAAHTFFGVNRKYYLQKQYKNFKKFNPDSGHKIFIFIIDKCIENEDY